MGMHRTHAVMCHRYSVKRTLYGIGSCTALQITHTAYKYGRVRSCARTYSLSSKSPIIHGLTLWFILSSTFVDAVEVVKSRLVARGVECSVLRPAYLSRTRYGTWRSHRAYPTTPYIKRCGAGGHRHSCDGEHIYRGGCSCTLISRRQLRSLRAEISSLIPQPAAALSSLGVS